MIRRDNFSFIDSLSLCRDSTPSCCMSCLGVTTTRTFRRPAFYAALLPRRGRIMRRTLSVRLSVCLSVRPVIVTLPSVTTHHLANYKDTHVLFGTR